VLWADMKVVPGEVWTELARREGMSGLEEKAARDPAKSAS
jgi:phosphoribosyl-ATP pyrophosphohydrolase